MIIDLVKYLTVASILFILGLKKLGHPRTAPTGNLYGSMGMLVAIIVTIAQMDFGETNNFILIAAGLAIGASIGYLMAVSTDDRDARNGCTLQRIWRCC
mgnify:CR=1 FL=1